MLYRKKPVVIEAVQFDGAQMVDDMSTAMFNGSFDVIPDWLMDALGKSENDVGAVFLAVNGEGGSELVIVTLEGIMCASPDDWIIKGVKGELYPCKPDIFEVTYIPALPEDKIVPEGARSWAQENLPKPVDLESAIAERNGWCETAIFHLNNESFYREVIEGIGGYFGDAAKTSDDGNVQQDVLILRVPELVKMELEVQAANHGEIARLNTEIERLTAELAARPQTCQREVD